MRFVQAGRYRASQYRPMPLGTEAAPTAWSKWVGIGVLAAGGLYVLRYLYKHTIGDG